MSRTGQAVSVRFLRLPEGSDLPVPRQASAHAAGFDLHARVDGPVELSPGERRLVPTGIAVAVPLGYEAQVRPRSGLAIKHGLALVNSPGTIDADYRGEIGVIAINLGHEPFVIRRGDRIAQLVVGPVPEITFDEVTELSETDRGTGGFGHTGHR